MTEFTNFVAQMDAAGVGVMLDGTFNHSAWDCEIGEVGVQMFPLETWGKKYLAAKVKQRMKWPVPISLFASVRIATRFVLI